ncbi:20S-pre-rRNA D-site endonuclease [Lachnellula occidentalis]|uniref:20S-pre-rRNA D-site endonuclease NOB1 n=1 Tax=Lachnellula occidentalis TaxID=215460 RepID=A0A8H8RJJ2_9HELO|nr:20S-pre-rRNA D-site endonuclease [Lachnellula occidentalis]
MATNTPKPIHSLVLDAGPIIKNDPSVSTFLSQAEILYTIPAVIDEIRDPATRSRVETTLKPFIQLRSPRPESVKIITDFARRTGDLEVLSRPDIHLMALAYELECERNHGDWRLRSVPGQKRVNGPPPTSLTEGTADPAVTEKDGETAVSAEAATQDAPAPTASTHSEDNSQVEEIEENLAEAHISTTDAGEAQDTAFAVQSPENEDTPQTDPVEEVQASDDDDDDDGEGWITPSNLKQHQQKDANGASEPQEEPKTMQVALITSDFAMQNVLLRMNLNLLSPSLQRIRQLKTWVLRCHACFLITRDMNKQFCTRCGKPTLLRTSCSTDKDGNFKVHLKKNMQWNNRGNVFSVPKPVAGTSNGKLVAGGGKGGWGQGLILAEDQKEYVSAMTTARRRKEKDLMDEDYLPGILSGDRGRAGGRTKVGAGKNVNSKKRNK